MRLLHWLSAFLVILALVLIESKGYWPKGSPEREALKSVHAQFGLLIFLVMWVRLPWRMTQRLPDITPPLPRLQALVAHLMHAVLNLMLLILPVLGILMMNAKDKAIGLFGVTLPSFIGPDKELAHTLQEAHETLGELMIWLIALHAAAALWHHWVQRDNTLRRML
ncbi:MAG: cytochrome b [Nitrosomonadales bacterium]|nr:cytochrome b [Nitrosomonadales bacterium]